MKPATFKQLGLIQWMVRMHKPELEKLKGYKNLKKISLSEASMLISMMKNDQWRDAKLFMATLESLHPNK